MRGSAPDQQGVNDARRRHWASGNVVSASWHARLQPLDAGWFGLAYAVPLMDTSRARSELGWSAATNAPQERDARSLGDVRPHRHLVDGSKR